MKPFQWAVMLIVVVAQCAFADSVSTFKITGATASVIQFIGTGDDLFFVFTGPGTDISAGGVILCQAWCEVGEIFPAGSKSPVAFGPEDIYLSGLGTVRLGGQSFFPDTAALGPLALSFSGGFTFPVNFKGSTFTACQPAAFSSPIPGSVETNNGQLDFDLLMPRGGKFCSTWDFIPASNGSPAGYLFDHGKFVAGTVPEPGTLGLMASGLAGLVGVILRKRNVRCSRNWQLPTTP